MLSSVEKTADYLQKLEADRLAAIAASEEKAREAQLIQARLASAARRFQASFGTLGSRTHSYRSGVRKRAARKTAQYTETHID